MKQFFLLISLILLATNIYARPIENNSKGNEILRKTIGIYDQQKNTVSNLEFITSNFGRCFYDFIYSQGLATWPYGSSNNYIFADGFWFGSKKKNKITNQMQKYVTVSYEPHSGTCWMVPGLIVDGDSARTDLENKYRLYFSTDFDNSTGQALDVTDGSAWSLWNISNNIVNNYGAYENEFVYDVDKRNTSNYPLGPSIISDEDIHCVYKDTDLSKYGSDSVERRKQGYPIRLECSQRIYSWADDELADVVVISYEITNHSTDTLMDCYFGKISDTDLVIRSKQSTGAENDRVRFFSEDGTLNLAVAWTDTTEGEAGQGFGYLGLAMLESPAVDSHGFVRTDKLIYPPSEQIGLTSFRNWAINQDPETDDQRYDFISTQIYDGDLGAGDMRMLLSTGPFNLKPGDKTRITVSYSWALPAKGGEADGTLEDISGLKKSAIGPDADNNSAKGSLLHKVTNIKNKYFTTYYNSINNNNSTNTNNGIEIQPNPAADFIEFTGDDAQFTNENIQIFNISGKLVLEMAYSKKINISHLNTGVYFITIGTKTELFIKN